MHAKRLQKLEVQHTFGCGAHTLTEWGLARSGEVGMQNFIYYVEWW